MSSNMEQLKTAISSDLLPLMESFLTIQGEGHYTGSAAYFIRLGGCDVGCVWCDVKESWDADKYPVIHTSAMSSMAVQSGAKIVVITGGEPLMYNMDSLTRELKDQGLRTHVETSGAHSLSGKWDWICFSPKKFKVPQPEYYDVAHELKVIVYNRSDLKWAEQHACKMNHSATLFLQPEWSRRNEMTPLIVDYVKKNPKWRISLQTHKYLEIP